MAEASCVCLVGTSGGLVVWPTMVVVVVVRGGELWWHCKKIIPAFRLSVAVSV